MTIQAVVKRKRKSRKGKGFSREELKEIGLSFGQALKLGIPIDCRRSTKHKWNVEKLKTYARESKREIAKTEERREKTRTPQVKVDLAKVKGIGSKISERLQEANIKNANELATSNPKKVAKAIGSSEDRASKFIEEARILLREQG